MPKLKHKLKQANYMQNYTTSLPSLLPLTCSVVGCSSLAWTTTSGTVAMEGDRTSILLPVWSLTESSVMSPLISETLVSFSAPAPICGQKPVRNRYNIAAKSGTLSYLRTNVYNISTPRVFFNLPEVGVVGPGVTIFFSSGFGGVGSFLTTLIRPSAFVVKAAATVTRCNSELLQL